HHLAAFDDYVQLADTAPSQNDLERVDETLSVRRDRWVQAGLASLYEAASADERTQMDGKLRARFEAAAASPGPAAAEQFLRYFGHHPLADAAREQLAERLATGGSWLSAELLWRRTERSTDAERSHRAVAKLSQMLLDAGRFQDAAAYSRRLSGELADLI